MEVSRVIDIEIKMKQISKSLAESIKLEHLISL